MTSSSRPPTEYEKLTFEGRCASDADHYGGGYCGSGTLEQHAKQCRNPNSWVQTCLKSWAGKARDDRAVKADREARKTLDENKERARALLRRLLENGMTIELGDAYMARCIELIERTLAGPDDPVHRFAARIAPFVDHGIGTRMCSIFEEELAHALAAKTP